MTSNLRPLALAAMSFFRSRSRQTLGPMQSRSKFWRIRLREMVVLALTLLAPLRAGADSPEPAPFKNPQQAMLAEVGIDQRLNEQVPLQLSFRDEAGRQVQLGDYFGERPVVLVMAYYQCPKLCNQVLNGLVSALKAIDFEAGEHYEVVVVSFDAREQPELAASKKHAYMHRLNRPGAEQGWHFLTGEQPEIDAITRAVGFRYQFDDRTQQFAHASGIMVATPDGRLARYFYGIDYSTRDLRLGIVEASAGTIGSPVDAVLLFCFHYDPTTGKYGLAIHRVLQAAGALTVLCLGALIVVLLRAEKRETADQSIIDNG